MNATPVDMDRDFPHKGMCAELPIACECDRDEDIAAHIDALRRQAQGGKKAKP